MKNLIIGICLLPLPFLSQTTKEVLTELEKQEVWYPEVVLAQAILETGWFGCEKCSLDKNNLFGLWDSRNQKYFEYDTWQESIGGYKRGIQYKFFRKDYKDYYKFLEEIGYAEDPNYISKLKTIVKKIQK